MNQKVKAKIEELYAVAQDENAPAVFVITHLLLAHYLQGTASEFAKTVCRFGSSVNVSPSANIDGGQEVLPGEVPNVKLPADIPEAPTEWVN